MKLLNVGCGSTFHKDWVNIDVISNSREVIAHDLTHGLPFEDFLFDGVYSSHVLEHFHPGAGEKLLLEMKRVLKPGGVLRVVVPDLEGITRHYLQALEAAEKGFPGAAANYQWMMLELMDQTVRTYSGGLMAEFLKGNVSNKEFIKSRIGKEATALWEPAEKPSFTSRITPGKILARLKREVAQSLSFGIGGKKYRESFNAGLFRNSGEIHQWMYDRYSLKELLLKLNFKNPKVTKATESLIPDFNRFNLDFVDGEVRKPDSLFMEALRP